MPLDNSHHRTEPRFATLTPLSHAAPGAHLRVAGITGGREMERRLTEMGLPRGAEFEVIGRMGRHGAVIVSVHGTRLVIGAGMADKIEVAPGNICGRVPV